jgi:choline dehydrogenase-like flavoprotein
MRSSSLVRFLSWLFIFSMVTATQYDVIIVGGGTAGLVLASRLSEDPSVSVLVVEAGNNAAADPRIVVPALFNGAQGTELDWSFATTPQVRAQNMLVIINIY